MFSMMPSFARTDCRRTKLLATEVRISSKLALKMAAGYELSRRENRQVQHTAAYQQDGWLTIFSSNVLSRIWAVSCPSRSSSSFLLLSCCSRWP
jgi:hypothetical protein